MPDPLMSTSTRKTPQSEKSRDDQVKNNAGGFVFETTQDARVHRFLTLGTDGGTYYAREQALTKENTGVVLAAARKDAAMLAQAAREISVAGRAPRNNAALYAVAAASALGNDEGRRAAFGMLPDVARIGTHLYTWAKYRELFGGWGRGAIRAVGGWYLGKSPEDLAYQMVKYRQREGWEHKDLLRLSHPFRPDLGQDGTPAHRALFDFACGRDADMLPPIIGAFQEAWSIEKADLTDMQRKRQWVNLIGGQEGFSLPWEAFPDKALTYPEVWRALIERGLPMTALMRKLSVLTANGTLTPMGDLTKIVAAQLADRDKLIKARVHPISILIALKTYSQGHGTKGNLSWTPLREITDALNDAFYLSYAAVEPAGKRTMLALDVSGSMGSPVAGIMGLSCREATAALALVTANTEPDYAITGFTSGSGPSRWGQARYGSGISLLNLSPKQRLDDAVRSIGNLPFGGTDCALPMLWAMETKTPVDTFVLATDNETWAGNIHPHQALRNYREKMGIPAKLVVMAMTPTNFTIADPEDIGMLDVSGFDSAIPGLIANFSRGDI